MSGNCGPVLLLLAFFTSAPNSGRDPAGDPVGRLPDWAKPGRCGTNSLYALTQILSQSQTGPKVTYEEVVRQLPPDNARGCSLADIARAARSIGISADVRKVSAEDLAWLPTPFIVHLDLLDQGGTGHFITVYHIQSSHNDEFIHYIDGTTGQMSNESLANLKPVLTGFILIPNRSWGGGGWPLLLVLFAGLGLGVGGAWSLSRAGRAKL